MYIIESAIVTITKATPKMIVHFFNIPSLVLPLFFSKKLFVDDPVIVAESININNHKILFLECLTTDVSK